MRRAFFGLVLFCCISSLLFAQDPLKGFEEYAEDLRDRWEVPGVAVAVVKDGKVIYAKGFGFLRVGSDEPVDETTLFGMGSTTKAFVAAALLMLAEEGKVDLDVPVVNYLPDFRLSDPEVTYQVTARDLLSHRVGFRNMEGDPAIGLGLDQEALFGRLHHLPLTFAFRTQYGYSNLMYMVAGRLVEAVSGMSWNEFLEMRIFSPLGMEQSVANLTLPERTGNVAASHYSLSAGISICGPEIDIAAVAPAGAIFSNVIEMAQWVAMQLGNGKQLLSPESIVASRKPETAIPLQVMRVGYPELTDQSTPTYGLGWVLHDYRGRQIVEHAGLAPGYTVMVSMMPEENLGIIVASNLWRSLLPAALKLDLYDRMLRVQEGRNWAKELRATELALETAKHRKEEELAASRIKGTSPSLPLSAFAGTYTHPFYGPLEVFMENGRLELVVGPARRQATLSHWHYDTFRMVHKKLPLPPVFVTFETDASGLVRATVDDLGVFSANPVDGIPDVRK